MRLARALYSSPAPWDRIEAIWQDEFRDRFGRICTLEARMNTVVVVLLIFVMVGFNALYVAADGNIGVGGYLIRAGKTAQQPRNLMVISFWRVNM